MQMFRRKEKSAPTPPTQSASSATIGGVDLPAAPTHTPVVTNSSVSQQGAVINNNTTMKASTEDINAVTSMGFSKNLALLALSRSNNVTEAVNFCLENGEGALELFRMPAAAPAAVSTPEASVPLSYAVDNVQPTTERSSASSVPTIVSASGDIGTQGSETNTLLTRKTGGVLTDGDVKAKETQPVTSPTASSMSRAKPPPSAAAMERQKRKQALLERRQKLEEEEAGLSGSEEPTVTETSKPIVEASKAEESSAIGAAKEAGVASDAPLDESNTLTSSKKPVTQQALERKKRKEAMLERRRRQLEEDQACLDDESDAESSPNQKSTWKDCDMDDDKEASEKDESDCKMVDSGHYTGLEQDYKKNAGMAMPSASPDAPVVVDDRDSLEIFVPPSPPEPCPEDAPSLPPAYDAVVPDVAAHFLSSKSPAVVPVAPSTGATSASAAGNVLEVATPSATASVTASAAVSEGAPAALSTPTTSLAISTETPNADTTFYPGMVAYPTAPEIITSSVSAVDDRDSIEVYRAPEPASAPAAAPASVEVATPSVTVAVTDERDSIDVYRVSECSDTGNDSDTVEGSVASEAIRISDESDASAAASPRAETAESTSQPASQPISPRSALNQQSMEHIDVPSAMGSGMEEATAVPAPSAPQLPAYEEIESALHISSALSMDVDVTQIDAAEFGVIAHALNGSREMAAGGDVIFVDALLPATGASIAPPASASNVYTVAASAAPSSGFVPIRAPEMPASTVTASFGAQSAQTQRTEGFSANISRMLYGEAAHQQGTQVRASTGVSTAVRANQRDTRATGPSIHRRIILPYSVQESSVASIPNRRVYAAMVNMRQPKLDSGAFSKSPQGKRTDRLLIGKFLTQGGAHSMCKVYSPPLWSGKNDAQVCTICNYTFAFLRKGHHCRNCGSLVCNKCSSKAWLSNMIPPTYHNNESNVRVCDCCFYLVEEFGDALRCGDMETAMSIYNTGNVNIMCPLSIYATCEYPVHAAAQGGNVELMKWLIRDRLCPLTDMGQPLKTADGLTALAVAAKYAQVDMMRYLVHNQQLVTDITNPVIALRGLHAALSAPGTLPPLPGARNIPTVTPPPQPQPSRGSFREAQPASENANAENPPPVNPSLSTRAASERSSRSSATAAFASTRAQSQSAREVATASAVPLATSGNFLVDGVADAAIVVAGATGGPAPSMGLYERPPLPDKVPRPEPSSRIKNKQVVQEAVSRCLVAIDTEREHILRELASGKELHTLARDPRVHQPPPESTRPTSSRPTSTRSAGSRSNRSSRRS